MDVKWKSAWARSLLLRVVTYSMLTSTLLGGFAAWVWRDDPRKLDTCGWVAFIVCFMFLLGYYLFGGVLWLFNALLELRSPSPLRAGDDSQSRPVDSPGDVLHSRRVPP